MARTSVTGAAGRRPGWGIGWLANRSISVKFLMVISVIGVVALGVGVSGILGMSRMQASSDEVYRGNLMPLTYLNTMERAALNMRIDVLNAGVSVDVQTAEKFLSKVAGDDAAFDKAVADFRGTADANGQAELAALQDAVAEYRKIRDTKLIPAVRAHDALTFGTVRDKEGAPAFNKVNAALDRLITMETDSAKRQNAADHAAYSSARLSLIVFLLVGLAVAVALGLFLARMVATAVRKVGVVVAALGTGDLTRTADVVSQDEIGKMAAALDVATARLRESLSVVAGSSQSLAGASEQLSGVNTQIAASADETNAQAQTVSAAAEQVSRNVQTVATGTEEMSASIRQIATSASEAAQIAGEAVAIVETVNQTVSQLGASSSEIGDVVSLITSIAEQTNLLALNATIEAARAGDAGKGFAVVATEVKELAQETAKATGDISARVATIQTDAEAAVRAIGQIVEVIEKINGYSTTIASAVEEQTSTTGEISRSVSEAATGSTQIAENITGVATASQQTSSGVNESRQAAGEVARMATELQAVVSRFTV